MSKTLTLTFLFLITLNATAWTQDSALVNLQKAPTKYIATIDNKINHDSVEITKPTEESLTKLSRQVSLSGAGQSLYTGLKKSIDTAERKKLVTTPQTIIAQLTPIKKLSVVHPGSLSKFSTNKNLLTAVFFSKPKLIVKGGYISYNLNYRSNTDTPIVEKDILQNSINGSLNLEVLNMPLRLNYLIRRSNSYYFKDINDVQLEYDANTHKALLENNLGKRLLMMLPSLRDSLLEANYFFTLKHSLSLHNTINDPLQLQKLLESQEILTLPDSISNGRMNDTLENEKLQTLKAQARSFIQHYQEVKVQSDSLSKKKDSLEALYNKMQDNITGFKNLIQHKLKAFGNTEELQNAIRTFGFNKFKIPVKYQRLLNIRKAGIGRNQLNYSELTSKNISITGVNFEYNSWYYLAVSAGSVNYRFRDFVVNKFNKSPQFIYLLRLGIGKLEHNHLILTGYQGQKQLFASGTNSAGVRSITIKGFAVEGKLRVTPSTYFIAEVAQSLSPDFRKNPVVNQKFDFKDKTNKAISLMFYSYLPATKSRIEAGYKYTGANFQSFSSFQTNSTLAAWSVKADQQLFKHRLKLSAAIKTSDFSNPYILQNYKSNTVFKSIQASFRMRQLPTISVGYVPVSQLTYLDSMLTESKFQSLNATITHIYKIIGLKATSSFVYNRFFNHLSDTTFAYYNSVNFFISQRVEYPFYTMGFSASHSKSPGFELNVLDGFLNFKIKGISHIGFGVKVNNFGRTTNAVGLYGSFLVSIKKLGILNAIYDNAFLPTNNRRFVKSNQLNINFIKQLN